MDTYQEMLEINEINLNSAREDLRLAQEMYKLNSATFLEVLDAQAAFTKAESDIIRIKYDMKIMEARLKLAMGTL
jgi:outer membrane protein TolC